jgi:hypothetical protein
MPGGGASVVVVAWLPHQEQPGGDQDVEDAAPFGVGAGHHLVQPEIDEVPDAMEEPTGGHQPSAPGPDPQPARPAPACRTPPSPAPAPGTPSTGTAARRPRSRPARPARSRSTGPSGRPVNLQQHQRRGSSTAITGQVARWVRSLATSRYSNGSTTSACDSDATASWPASSSRASSPATSAGCAVYRARHQLIVAALGHRFARHLEVIPSAAGLHLAAIARSASAEELEALLRRASAAGVELRPPVHVRRGHPGPSRAGPGLWRHPHRPHRRGAGPAPPML